MLNFLPSPIESQPRWGPIKKENRWMLIPAVDETKLFYMCYGRTLWLRLARRWLNKLFNVLGAKYSNPTGTRSKRVKPKIKTVAASEPWVIASAWLASPTTSGVVAAAFSKECPPVGFTGVPAERDKVIASSEKPKAMIRSSEEWFIVAEFEVNTTWAKAASNDLCT